MGMGDLAPFAPDKLRPSLPHVFHLPFSSIPFPSSPNWRGVHRLRPVHCNVRYGPTITQPFHRYDTFENRRFERLLKPVKAATVYLQCMFRDSHCYFSSMRLKSGGYGTPTSKSGGTRTPHTPESYAYGYIFRMKFPTGFTCRNLHGFARFPCDSTALVISIALNSTCDRNACWLLPASWCCCYDGTC